MGKPKDPRRYPLEYLELLDRAFLGGEPLQVAWPSAQRAQAFRFDFYGWVAANEAQANKLIAQRRHAEAEEHQRIVARARQLILSFKPPATIEIVNRADGTFSQQLRNQGFAPQVPQLNLDVKRTPHRTGMFKDARPEELEAVIEKLGYVGAQLRAADKPTGKPEEPSKPDDPPQTLAELMAEQARTETKE